jgi:hypothetical protein
MKDILYKYGIINTCSDQVLGQTNDASRALDMQKLSPLNMIYIWCSKKRNYREMTKKEINSFHIALDTKDIIDDMLKIKGVISTVKEKRRDEIMQNNHNLTHEEYLLIKIIALEKIIFNYKLP